MSRRKKTPALPSSRDGMDTVLLALPAELLKAVNAEAAARSVPRAALLREVVARHVAGVCPTCGGTGRAG